MVPMLRCGLVRRNCPLLVAFARLRVGSGPGRAPIHASPPSPTGPGSELGERQLRAAASQAETVATAPGRQKPADVTVTTGMNMAARMAAGSTPGHPIYDPGVFAPHVAVLVRDVRVLAPGGQPLRSAEEFFDVLGWAGGAEQGAGGGLRADVAP